MNENTSQSWPLKFTPGKSASFVGALVFCVTLLIFLASPIYQVTDSNYSMLVSQSLLEHGSFTLDGYAIPRMNPVFHDNTYKNGSMYQLELVGDHLYYYFPPGTSVLSVPYVALMNLCGVSAANADGTYNRIGETKIQSGLAALLMAALAAIFFCTGRLVLPVRWSAVVALAGALGTQVWSTASRAMWADTWGIFLLGIVVYMLLAQETGKRKLNLVLLASLLAWTYFVRPTNALHILAITVYVLIFHRRLFIRYAVAGMVWLAGFVIYSWHHFGQMLPNYYLASRLTFSQGWTAMGGNLISPSRGLLIYVPVLFFVIYVLVRHRRYVNARRLVPLALAVVAGHLIVIAGFTPWNGGYCYGPRYSAGLVPWFVLLGILGVKAMLRWRESDGRTNSLPSWKAQLASGAALLILSIFINARGAISYETWLWNVRPTNVDEAPEKVWDWRHPQFLAGLLLPPLPREFAPAQARIDFSTREADKFLWYGWGANEPQFRWSDGNRAAFVFALDEMRDAVLRIKLGPFLAPGKLAEQKVNIKLNGQQLETLSLREEATSVYGLILPRGILRDKNILIFEMPNAASPSSLGVGDDRRQLGIRVEWIELQSQANGN